MSAFESTTFLGLLQREVEKPFFEFPHQRNQEVVFLVRPDGSVVSRLCFAGAALFLLWCGGVVVVQDQLEQRKLQIMTSVRM